MAHNGGTPRLLAKYGSAVEVFDKQQIEDPPLARVKRARTTGHTDSLPAMALRTHLGGSGWRRAVDDACCWSHTAAHSTWPQPRNSPDRQ
jgi:hypothetical protein